MPPSRLLNATRLLIMPEDIDHSHLIRAVRASVANDNLPLAKIQFSNLCPVLERAEDLLELAKLVPMIFHRWDRIVAWSDVERFARGFLDSSDMKQRDLAELCILKSRLAMRDYTQFCRLFREFVSHNRFRADFDILRGSHIVWKARPFPTPTYQRSLA